MADDQKPVTPEDAFAILRRRFDFVVMIGVKRDAALGGAYVQPVVPAAITTAELSMCALRLLMLAREAAARHGDGDALKRMVYLQDVFEDVLGSRVTTAEPPHVH